MPTLVRLEAIWRSSNCLPLTFISYPLSLKFFGSFARHSHLQGMALTSAACSETFKQFCHAQDMALPHPSIQDNHLKSQAAQPALSSNSLMFGWVLACRLLLARGFAGQNQNDGKPHPRAAA